MAVTAERICEYRHCDVSVEERRPNVRYCTGDHKRAEWRLRQGDPPGTTYPVEKPSESVRRASRDGSGAKLYLLPDDLEWLTRCADAPEHLRESVDRAVRRLAA